MGTVIEREPDHDSRDRGRIIRLGLGAAVALVLLVVLVVVVVDSTKSRSASPGGSKHHGEHGPEHDDRAHRDHHLGSGRVHTGAAAVGDGRDPQLAARGYQRRHVHCRHRGPQRHAVDEDGLGGRGDPEAARRNVADVTFFGGTPNTILADPVVSFDVTVKPGKRVRVGYRIHVPPDGTDTSRLLWWKSNRDAAAAGARHPAQHPGAEGRQDSLSLRPAGSLDAEERTAVSRTVRTRCGAPAR